MILKAGAEASSRWQTKNAKEAQSTSDPAIAKTFPNLPKTQLLRLPTFCGVNKFRKENSRKQGQEQRITLRIQPSHLAVDCDGRLGKMTCTFPLLTTCGEE